LSPLARTNAPLSSFAIARSLSQAVEASLRGVLLLHGVAHVFFEEIVNRLGLKFDSEIERQGGNFIFELRNILVSMDNCFLLVFKNGE
jgi:hypothetical protein